MNEVTTTKERVLKAAQSCAQVERVMKTLFPQVFEEEQTYDLYVLVNGDLSINTGESNNFGGVSGKVYGVSFKRDVKNQRMGCPEELDRY